MLEMSAAASSRGGSPNAMSPAKVRPDCGPVATARTRPPAADSLSTSALIVDQGSPVSSAMVAGAPLMTRTG